MTYTLRVRPPYSQIMMRDPSARVEVPEWKKGVPFVATATCILYGCYPDMDGETQITVGTANQIDADSSPVFDGMLRTPSHKIALQTVEGDLILEVTTIGDTTPVRVWANRNWLPDIVTIGIDWCCTCGGQDVRKAMKQTTFIRPAYSQVVICDPTAKVEVPLWEWGVPFVANDTCILFMCYPEIDGPTGLTFGNGDDVRVQGDPICERMLKTAGRQIGVETAEGDGIFRMPTKGTETMVRIWSNRSWLPDKVIIGVD